MMQAASEGAAKAGNVQVAAIRIAREAGHPLGATAAAAALMTGPPPLPSTSDHADQHNQDVDPDGRLRLASYLAPDHVVTCAHMATRKAALSSCGLRMHVSHRTAYIFLPGGISRTCIHRR